MDNFLFLLLIDAVDLADRQSALIAVLEAQRDQALDVATRAVAQMKNAKLAILADHIRTRQDFHQDSLTKCIVAIGLELAGIPISPIRSQKLQAFASYYGVSYDVATDIYLGKFGNLFEDERTCGLFQLETVTREEASRILRRLAARG
jgi:hypothetical protein